MATVKVTDQPLSFWQTSNPSLRGAYIFSVENQAGVVAANTFLTLFNPVGSGRLYLTSAAFISCVAGAAASATRAMRGYRISAAPTGGTVQAANTVCKLDTLYPDTGADIRIGNPTVTLGPAAWNTPPPATTGAGGGQFVHAVELPPGSPLFLLRPGEGIAINCQAGDVDQVWNLTVTWGEV